MRIDAATKAEADAAFAGAGLSPSEVVRATYLRPAELGQGLRDLSQILVTDEGVDRKQERLRRRRALERAESALASALSRYGLGFDVSACAPMTDEEVEQALFEDYLSKGRHDAPVRAHPSRPQRVARRLRRG